MLFNNPVFGNQVTFNGVNDAGSQICITKSGFGFVQMQPDDIRHLDHIADGGCWGN